jgi:putative CocE/NonD family hydrolase
MSDPNATAMDRREFVASLLGATGWIALPSSPASGGPHVGSDYTLLSDVMVTMRDGVRLATDVYLPVTSAGTPARYPLILERTPYNKTTPSRSERTPTNPTPLGRAEVAAFFTRRGYAVVYQDCRGRYKSEGEFVKYLSDGNDGYDTCSWIVKQPWCNGRIGTMGLSYAAHTQGALGSAAAPGVAAMFLDSGGFSNAYQDGIRQGGAFELKQATWAFNQALESPELQRDPAKLAAMKAIDIRDCRRCRGAGVTPR